MMKKNHHIKKVAKILIASVFLVLFLQLNALYLPINPSKKSLEQDSILIEEHSTGNSPHSAAFREDNYIDSKQLINDSEFNLSPNISPWKTSYSGDLSDLNAKIENLQSNSTIIGDKQTISIIANFAQPGEWKNMTNPNFPAYPEWNTPYNGFSFGNDSSGLWANHTWNEGSRQAPSVNWVRNVTMPVNVSDYTITSASIRSVVNASVDANLEVTSSEANPTTQFVIGDYARFYVRVADLSRINVHEIASNRTAANLGQDSGPITTQVDANMTSVNDDLLKVYLTSALSQDYQNFTIILGIDFWCEDNRGTDTDTWNMLRIKNFNLSFTLEKKINYNSEINWNETGYMINKTDYLRGGDSIETSVINATLNFNYRVTQAWPATSPNSEIRVYINNYLHTETIKLSNGTTSFQAVKGGQGFDISSLISFDQNVTIRLQIIMLDNFILSQNCSLLLDSINLTVFFLSTVRTTIPSTQLQLVGSTNIAVPWNESFTITANYTRTDTWAGISGANITLTWIDSAGVLDIGNGLYNITCNNTVTSANQHYSLQILAEAYGNETKTYIADISIIERPTKLHIFLDQVDSTSLPEITVSWNKTVNITALYQDSLSGLNRSGALVGISGTDLNPSSYSYSEIGLAYQFLVNSSYFEVGSHFISLLGSLGNHSLVSKIITFKVTARPTYLSILRNTINVTTSSELNVPITGSIILNLNYYDSALNLAQDNYNVSLQGLSSSFYTITPGTTSNVTINTNGLGLGVYIVSVIAGKSNYTQLSHTYQLNVNQIQTNITGKLTYTIAPNQNQVITLVVTDTDFNLAVSGCVISYSGRLGSGDFTEVLGSPGTYATVIENIPEGEYTLDIAVYKEGAMYHFPSSITITIVAVQSIEGGIPPWVMWVLIAALIGIVVLFIQYQLVWKYPPHIRKVRRIVRDLKSGNLEKKGTSLTFRPAESSFAEQYLSSSKQELTFDAQSNLKNKYLITKKVGPASREIPKPISKSHHSTKASESVGPETPPATPSPPKESLPGSQTTPSSSVHMKPVPAPVSSEITSLAKNLTQTPPPKDLPSTKQLPQIKELPTKPATKPAFKPEEKPAEKSGDEQK